MAEAHFTSPIAVEIIGNFVANVPPNPQHVSDLGHLDELQSANIGEQGARRFLDAEFAQAVAAIVKRDLVRKFRAEIGDAKFFHENSENSQVRDEICLAKSTCGVFSKSSG